MKKVKSNNRLQARQLEGKIQPAIKLLSMHVSKTSNVPEQLVGYELPAGEYEKNGLKWQLQIKAVCHKSKFIKKPEVRPILNKWAVGLRIRIFVKLLTDWIYDN